MRLLSLLLAHMVEAGVLMMVASADDGTIRSKGFLMPAATTHRTEAPSAPASPGTPERTRQIFSPTSRRMNQPGSHGRRRMTATMTAAAPGRHHVDALQSHSLGSGPATPDCWCMIRGGSRPQLPRNSPSGGRIGEQQRQQRVRSVLLYYPNIIGYVRVALVLASYYLAETNWKASSLFYVVAFAGDAVDGHVARKFNQASRFGAVLDMVTDRCSTAGLLLILSRLYDRHHAFAFLVLMFIDLFSHWMHTHSVVDKHHKSNVTLRRRNILIRTYYDHLPFFAFCCIGTELFYVLLYLLHFVSPEGSAFDPLRKACFWLCLPACVLKQLINIAQIFSAARTLALDEIDQ